MKKKHVHIRLKEECDLKNKIMVVLVAFTLVLATVMIVSDKACINPCMETHAITEIIVELIDDLESSCIPINRNCQEYAITEEKIDELESPADYMDGLTAISKRCIYVGEAECFRLAVKRNI